MLNNGDIEFKSSAIKIPLSSPQNPIPHLPFCSQSLTSTLSQAKFSITQFLDSLKFHRKPIKLRSFPSPLLCSSTLALNESTQAQPGGATGGGGAIEVAQTKAPVSRTRREDEERVLISEVLVRNKDGEELEMKDLESEALMALKACRANSALTVREVQEDVHRIIDSGYFSSCMPVAVDTRDGIRLVFQVEPNQEFRGLVCEGANVLPSKFVEDKFRDGYGKVVNIRHLDEVIESINGWYMERGLFGMVSGVEILSGGILRLQIAEAEVNDVSIRFLDRKTREPTVGKTKPETILRQLTTKKGQVKLLHSLLYISSDITCSLMCLIVILS
ncbi:outer envelope protein 80, chloroplastic-like isoform X1 [Chenopodium quinoa]|uniref:outer envelope protein 80, chloroplastic-like isoform X1 n=1 Tax=Chenopodium quinoa TaxID=63459 RepID=UPI000B776741|nr:outer envelope protein 80, chloroplastic-like isoform X1 [Chenopodium quinoa]